MEKVREKEELSVSITNIAVPAEVTQVLGQVNLAIKYIWSVSNSDMDAATELGLIDVKKY